MISTSFKRSPLKLLASALIALGLAQAVQAQALQPPSLVSGWDSGEGAIACGPGPWGSAVLGGWKAVTPTTLIEFSKDRQSVRVTGGVLLNGRPAPSARVIILSNLGHNFANLQDAVTDSAGSYSITIVAPSPLETVRVFAKNICLPERALCSPLDESAQQEVTPRPP